MNKREALIKALEFNKVRPKNWRPGVFIYYDEEDGCFRFENKECYYLSSSAEENDSEWEIYEKLYDKKQAIKAMLEGEELYNKNLDVESGAYTFVGDRFLRNGIKEVDINALPFDGWFK